MRETARTIPTHDGPMRAYVAMPDASGPMPGLLVAQEAFGVNDHIRDICRRFARESWVAMAPELFHRTGAGLEFRYDEQRGTPAGEKLASVLAGLNTEGMASDLSAALTDLRSLPEVDPTRTAIVGFCMGGYASFLAACRFDVKTAVCFYPGGLVRKRPQFGLEPILDEAPNLRRPVLLLFGEADPSIPPADVEIVRNRLVELAKEHEIVVYDRAKHGFFCDKRASYDETSAKAAWHVVLEWLAHRV